MWKNGYAFQRVHIHDVTYNNRPIYHDYLVRNINGTNNITYFVTPIKQLHKINYTLRRSSLQTVCSGILTHMYNHFKRHENVSVKMHSKSQGQIMSAMMLIIIPREDKAAQADGKWDLLGYDSIIGGILGGFH